MLFTGEYEHTIDTKHRLAIPAEIRSRLRPEIHGEALYIAPGANGHLWLWPERTFEELANALEKSLVPGEELMEFEELLFPASRRLEIDKAGRVLIPEQMLVDYSLKQTVVILGMNDHLELRDPALRKQQRKEKHSKQAEIVKRARKMMSKGKDNDSRP